MTLKQATAAGEVAQAMWRLLVAECSRHEMGEPERVARQVIDTTRHRQETALDVYVMASFAAALATTADSDADRNQ